MNNNLNSLHDHDSVAEHKQQSAKHITFSVLTISDSRQAHNDRSGTLIKELMIAAGHKLIDYKIVKDEKELIADAFKQYCSNCHVILTSGGTGLAMRDCTPQAIRPLLDIELEGFGELFRMLSFEEIGTAAMLSRAFAGRRQQTLCFSMPGSSAAVQLAVSKIIIPELPHAVGLLEKND